MIRSRDPAPRGRSARLRSAHGCASAENRPPPSATARDARAERGSATVLVLAVVAVALVLAVGAVALARTSAARGAAQTAADLAAVAAASAAHRPGAGAACAVAADVVRRNGGVLQGCEQLADGHVRVQVAVSVEPFAGWRTVATATARAGPVR